MQMRKMQKSHGMKCKIWCEKVPKMRKNVNLFCQNITSNFYKAHWVLFFVRLLCRLLTVCDVEGCLSITVNSIDKATRESASTGIASSSSALSTFPPAVLSNACKAESNSYGNEQYHHLAQWTNRRP